jgi:dipeptide transport system substrate-binding protein
MKRAALLLTATVLAAGPATVAEAKQLVFCSEASPAGFDPSPWSGGNDFDASARTIYSRLVEFDKGKTTISPGLAESW